MIETRIKQIQKNFLKLVKLGTFCVCIFCQIIQGWGTKAHTLQILTLTPMGN